MPPYLQGDAAICEGWPGGAGDAGHMETQPGAGVPSRAWPWPPPAPHREVAPVFMEYHHTSLLIRVLLAGGIILATSSQICSFSSNHPATHSTENTEILEGQILYSAEGPRTKQHRTVSIPCQSLLVEKTRGWDSASLGVSGAEANPSTACGRFVMRNSELGRVMLQRDCFNEALFLCVSCSHRFIFFLASDIILHHPCHMEERNEAVLICCHKNMKCCLCDLQSRLELGISTLVGLSTCWNSFSFQSGQATVVSSFLTN